VTKEDRDEIENILKCCSRLSGDHCYATLDMDRVCEEVDALIESRARKSSLDVPVPTIEEALILTCRAHGEKVRREMERSKDERLVTVTFEDIEELTQRAREVAQNL
jgi:hypothetical protein